MNTNRKVGNGFEKELCRVLASYGFWCHNMAQNSQGQPFDVIAARGGMCHPIDCKDCVKNIFKLERIEENQSLSMRLWRATGNGESWFALRLNTGEVYMISYSNMEVSMVEKSALSEREIRVLGIPLGEWVKLCK